MAGPGETKAEKRRGADFGADARSKADERRAFWLDAEPRIFPPAPRADAPNPPPATRAEASPALQQGPRRRLGRAGALALVPRARAALSRALEEEGDFGTPFLLVPVLLLSGVAAYFALPAEPAAHNVPSALGLALALWAATRRRSRPAARALLALLLVLGGMGIAQWQTMARATPMLGAEVTTHLTGRIARIEARPNGAIRYTLDVIATERPHLRHAPDRVRVSARSPAKGVRVGDGLKGVARLFPLSGPARPGSYDFAFHGFFAGHGANGFFYGAPAPVAVPPAQGLMRGLARRLQNARLWLGGRIRAAAPGETGTVAAALVNGDKSAIPEPVNEALRISGLAHILTISGLHMALVAGTVMAALRAAFALSGTRASGRAIKKHAALAAFAAIFVYLFLAGAGVATQRSFTMLAVMLAALMLDRRAISKRNLAIAAIIIIVLFPASVVGPSFHMSFAATLALIALYDIWTRARAERLRRSGAGWRRPEGMAAARQGALRFVTALAATSIVAGAASGLYAAYHFQRVAVLGLVTNLAAMPIVSFVTMPLAIVATLAIPFGLDGPLYAMMAASAGWIMAIAQWVADRSPDGMVGAMSNGAMLMATAALAWLCICRTWLRWGALMPAVLAAVLMGQRDAPLAVISEDGRQMAIVRPDGSLAVNRSRPNGFILEQWRQAYAARGVVGPERSEAGATHPGRAEKGRATHAGGPMAMRCAENMCTGLAVGDGAYLAMAILSAPLSDRPETGDGQPTAGRPAAGLCGRFDLIVLAYAPAMSPCTDGTLVVTAQELALKGSAEVRLGRPAGDGRAVPIVSHAVSMPLRPWHDHRRWSRAARNLAPRR